MAQINEACTPPELSRWTALTAVATDTTNNNTATAKANAKAAIVAIRRDVTSRLLQQRLSGINATIDTNPSPPDLSDSDENADEADAFARNMGPPAGTRWSEMTYTDAKILAGRARSSRMQQAGGPSADGNIQFPVAEDPDDMDGEMEFDFDE